MRYCQQFMSFKIQNQDFEVLKRAYYYQCLFVSLLKNIFKEKERKHEKAEIKSVINECIQSCLVVCREKSEPWGELISGAAALARSPLLIIHWFVAIIAEWGRASRLPVNHVLSPLLRSKFSFSPCIGLIYSSWKIILIRESWNP